MRLIDADAFKSYIDCGHLRSPTENCFSELDVVHMLDKRPTINAVPIVHARWILSSTPEMVKVSYDGWMHCPKCKKAFRRIVGTQLFAYCPNCGAKMDGEENAAD